MFWQFFAKPLGLVVTLFKLPLSQFISKASQTYDATATTNRPLIFMSAFILENCALKPLLTRSVGVCFQRIRATQDPLFSNKVMDACVS